MNHYDMTRYEADFDDAMDFLDVSRSTLNRWLRDGKVPARKVGGQWRFSRAELQALRDGSEIPASLIKARRDLQQFLASRRKDSPMNASADATPQALAEALLWEAVDGKATDVHLQPRRDGVHVAFGTRSRLSEVRVIPPALAAEIEEAWAAIGRPFGETGMSRIFLSRGAEAAVNEVSLVLQSLDTLQGRRLTLRVMGGGRVTDLEHVAPRDADRETFRKWLSRSRGLILFAGPAGSGKTTTLLSCLQHLATDARLAVFSLEYPAYLRVDGVDQVEVASDGPAEVKTAMERIFRMAPNAVGICVETAEAARAALNVAVTGHLVLMQIESESAEGAVKRFEDLAGRPAAGSIVGVVSQRLRRGAGGTVAEYRFWEPTPSAGASR